MAVARWPRAARGAARADLGDQSAPAPRPHAVHRPSDDGDLVSVSAQPAQTHRAACGRRRRLRPRRGRALQRARRDRGARRRRGLSRDAT